MMYSSTTTLPFEPMTFSSPVVAAASPLVISHRGFALTLRRMPGRFGPDSFGYVIHHDGLVLHESGGDYRAASSAARAARRFVDDALEAFDHASLRLEAEV